MATTLMLNASPAWAQSPAARPLQELAAQRGLLIGAAAAPRPLLDDQRYAAVLAREFSIVTPENALKWPWVQPDPGRFTWQDADAIVHFAVAHGQKVRAHTALWHLAVPAWIVDGRYDTVALQSIVQQHMRAVAQRYAGQLTYWDVVNEAVADDGRLRDTLWLRKLGRDYIAQAFTWAHQAAPNVKLVYNDYGAEEPNAKSDAIYALVRSLKARRVPIAAVGFQMHLGPRRLDPQKLYANFQRFARLGVELHVTEMDLPLGKLEGTPEQRLAEQARRIRAVIDVCLAVPAVKVIQFWGVDDNHSWLNREKQQSPLLFDTRYQPKPAYWAVAEALTRHHAAADDPEAGN